MEKNPIIGNIVIARVRLQKEEDKKKFIFRLKNYSSEKMQHYKIPIKVIIVEEDQYSNRYKKIRHT